MKAQEAYNRAVEKTAITIGRDGHSFALVGWQHPDTGRKQGPIIVTVSGTECVEVSRKGKFIRVFPAAADHYFPWVEVSRGL